MIGFMSCFFGTVAGYTAASATGKVSVGIGAAIVTAGLFTILLGMFEEVSK